MLFVKKHEKGTTGGGGEREKTGQSDERLIEGGKRRVNVFSRRTR